MQTSIEFLNGLGARFLGFAWPMLWQSSLLIAFVFALDFLLARKIRASVRYALWLAVLVKLLLPPTLALPTGAAWWLFQTRPAPVAVMKNFTVTYGDAPSEPEMVPTTLAVPMPPLPKLEAAGLVMLAAGMVSVGLFMWLMVRWWQVARTVRGATQTDEFSDTLESAARLAGFRSPVRLKIVEGTMSPAVCGLFRPVILLPRALADKLSPAQLRAVLLHEIFHLRRRDVWMNCAQALLQIVYWWHPLLWAANARIRQVREEAVDDAVMLTLREEADGYAPTLLEVAKLALRRPLLSLGLVGIMESRSALRHRIERLVDFHAPRKAGLTLLSLCGIFVFSAVALPMGESPATVENQAATEPAAAAMGGPVETTLTVKVNPDVFIRNVMAQADKIFHSTNDAYTDILVDILRRENLDCNPPHGLAFNTKTGEITTQNSLENQDIFREVIEQLNREDGRCALPLKSAMRRRQVLITADFYALPTADYRKLVDLLDAVNISTGKGFAGSISAAHAGDFDWKLKSLGLSPFQRPRIQTSHGMSANFFTGDALTNGVTLRGVELDCLPYIGDGVVDLAYHIDATGDLTSKGMVYGPGRQTLSGRNVVEDHGRLIVCPDNPDGSFQTNLVAVLELQILTNTAPRQYVQRLNKVLKTSDRTKAPSQFQQRLQGLIKLADGTNAMAEADATRLNQTAPQIHIKARFFEIPGGSMDFGGFLNQTNSSPDSFNGVLNKAETKTVLNSLELIKGMQTLAEPEATTTSGRQMQMRATQIVTVITNFLFEDSITNGHASSITPQMAQVETGPILDVVPYVLADGYTINLTVIPSLTEFLGYASPPNVPNVTGTNNRVQLPVILPQFNVRQVTASLNLLDGQTVVICGLPEVNHYRHKTPVLGSVPLVGRLFQSDNASTNEILVMITADMVDSAGNRLHTDSEINSVTPARTPIFPGSK